MEISYSRFERTIELPEPIEPAEVTPDFWRGFLLVRIDREEGR
jgi:HSP20 family molecular chaperone IbpA